MKEDLVLYHLAEYKNEIRFFLNFPEQLKGHDEGIFFWWHDLKFRRNTFETVTIMIWRTPLMESMFTYVFQKYLNQPWFQSYDKRSSGSQIIGYGAHVPPFSADVPFFWSLKSVSTQNIFWDCCSFFTQKVDPWEVKECIWDSNKGRCKKVS